MLVAARSMLAALAAALLLTALLVPPSAAAAPADASAASAIARVRGQLQRQLDQRALVLQPEEGEGSEVVVEVLPRSGLDALRPVIAAAGGEITGEVPGHLL